MVCMVLMVSHLLQNSMSSLLSLAVDCLCFWQRIVIVFVLVEEAPFTPVSHYPVSISFHILSFHIISQSVSCEYIELRVQVGLFH